MKSIQTKFVALILTGIVLSAVIVGGAGIYNSKVVVENDSARIMNLMCGETSRVLNNLFRSVEQSVEMLAVYALDQLESADRLVRDEEYREQYTLEMEELIVNVANNTEGALAFYLRYNPELMPPASGLFWSKTEQYGSFQKLTPTDFSRYAPADVEHVGWYYIPVKEGKAVWIDPYLNKNINIQMISYVVPLYKDNTVIGVVGMDIDFSMITDIVDEVTPYEGSYAFLVNSDSDIMYHNTLSTGTSMRERSDELAQVANELKNGTSGSALFSYRWGGEGKKMAFRTLSNDMRLVITAPASEIDAEKNSLIRHIVMATLCISVCFIVITVLLTRRIVRPLKELNAAAKKIAEGDLSVSLSWQTKDEVGTLADSFQQTVSHLQKYIDYINGLAYRDSLTGVKNKTAYEEAIRKLEEQMHLGSPEFAVLVMDINGLKTVNDTYGHDFGDMLIISATRLIAGIFKRSPLFRIGGDEFVVILEKSDYENYGKLLQQLEEALEQEKRTAAENRVAVSIARGIAFYNPDTDLAFANIFKRADMAMYENKEKMREKVKEEQ